MRKPKPIYIPPAFPNRFNEGMNIRDHFAVTALPTIMAHRPDDSADKKAAAAYQIADAMMKLRGLLPD
jgi:hypothetical protein